MPAALLLVGFALGLIIGRWWALLGAAGVGLWIAGVSEVDEVPPWFLGLAYALISGVGVAAGVGLRLQRRRSGGAR